MIKSGLFASWLLLATGEALSSSASEAGSIAGMVANLGALGVLSVVTFFLFKDMQSQRKENAAQRKENTHLMTLLCDRWDGWEKIRHEDSNKLDGALREITSNCAAVQAGIVNK